MSTLHTLSSMCFIAYGAGSLAPGTYYEGDKDHYQDTVVPVRPVYGSVWTNPTKPTFADWVFTPENWTLEFGYDNTTGGYWVEPEV